MTTVSVSSQPSPETSSKRLLARVGAYVLGNFIDALGCDLAISRILQWGSERQSRSVCLCNVHSSITAHDAAELGSALASADMVLPDGAPIAWMLRRKGFVNQRRVTGPDLMLQLCAALETEDIGVFLFGSSEKTLKRLTTRLQTTFPKLDIRGALSPDYGEWSSTLEREYIDMINRSGAGIIFVGLGCPRQEIWIERRKNDIHGVLLGVGAAFDFHAGTIKRAPEFLQKLGLEWLHRLVSEPRRLWRRYLITNTRFILLSIRELLSGPRANR
jgi:N-acetylglucosaminyldiphosphoundecaprenol N-acetyl-beta-D-mannosaminyltransferase